MQDQTQIARKEQAPMDEPDALSTFGEQHPSSQDHQTWKVFWAKRGQQWRTEPEIDAQRQAELAALVAA